MSEPAKRVVIIGAGIGGLAAALRLSHAGCAVTVIEAQPDIGGKMRCIPSAAGPIDAGPTVLTMRPVFEALFSDCDLSLADHVTLEPCEIIARHFWDDGTCFDLMADRNATLAHVRDTFGASAADDYARFAARTARLFAGFYNPMMQTAAPGPLQLARHVLRNPRLISDMAPFSTLGTMLRRTFREPRLAQLFGRYATYVGGTPDQSPAILSLIADAEAQGVWVVDGGMFQLAKAMAACAMAKGTTFQFNTPVTRITQHQGRVNGVETATGRKAADVVLFNGDPRAIAIGCLGPDVARAVPDTAVTPRSLSAFVHAFAARPKGPPLAHHNVFFANDPGAEFAALQAGQRPRDATLYLCAQDHGRLAPTALQRFEIIMNGPPNPQRPAKEISQCQTQVFDRLARFGMQFTPTPEPNSLTTPAGFAALFPASQGSLYGRSPHGMMAAFARPTARTAVPGLFLVGGGAHPGAGVPMATLSARHAAEAIMRDPILTSTSHQTATHGGMSTGSAPTGNAPSA